MMRADMSDTTVLFIWQVRDELRAYLEQGLAGVEGLKLVFPEDAGEESLLRLAPDADVIVGWRPSPELLDAARKLRLLINPGAGVQHLLPKYADRLRDRSVVLVNGHGNTYFTAQHAVALLLALMNRVVFHHDALASGNWRTREPKSIPLRDRVVGLFGYGHVNRKVHLFLSGFDVAFAVLRRTWEGKTDPMPTPAARFEPRDLGLFLERVDTLIVCLPETGETRGMLGRDELDRLGPNGLLVHVGRGPVIDEQALYEALRDGRIAGAGLDVWYDYRPEPDAEGRKFPFTQPFHELDNVVLSPHRGASPLDDLKRWDEVVDNITRFSAGRSDFLNVVDVDLGY